MSNSKLTSPFGFRQLDPAQKTSMVQRVFSSVSQRYDLMNDLMSGGVHRIWKWYAINLINYAGTKAIVDLACGSGDLLLAHTRYAKDDCTITGIDPNPEMLDRAKYRLADKGIFAVELITAAAEQLPLEDDSQCLITMSFGLRNTTDMQQSLRECLRVLRPGGRIIVLEFSQPQGAMLQQAYSWYSRCIPRLGKWVTNDRDSYQYLVDSIQTHPDQAALADRMTAAGFAVVSWINLTGGIVAIHSGYKP